MFVRKPDLPRNVGKFPSRISILSRFIPIELRKSREQNQCRQYLEILRRINVLIGSSIVQKEFSRIPSGIEAVCNVIE
jgi:hypothetical protein